MNTEKKEVYVSPELVKHELLRDITATRSGNNSHGFGGFGRFGGFGGFGGFGRFGRFGRDRD